MTQNSIIPYKSKIFHVEELDVELPTGKVVRRGIVRHPGAVVIIPVLSAKELLILSQYRHALGETILEFPAGTLNVGENPMDCAKREICEETGYQAGRWTEIGEFFPAPGFCDERQFAFVASNLSPMKLDADEDEIIDVRVMSPGEVEKSIVRGQIKDGKSIALYFKAKLMGLIE